MKTVSKITKNALKILEYLIDRNAINGSSIVAQDIFNNVELPRDEFVSALSYLSGKLCVQGTIGGMNGRRWITPTGIDFYDKNAVLIDVDPNKQGRRQMPDPKKVFVVHGRDGRLRHDFFAFLRALDLDPIEWSEALSLTGAATPYIGQVLDSAFSKAQAVIVLLTPDDEVRLSPDLWKDNEDESEKIVALQSRPNVLFEAGMAFGTHPDRTLLVEVGKVKAFSDVAGRHVVRLANSPESRHEIAERLKTAGCGVSTSGQDWLRAGEFAIQREVRSESEDYHPGDLVEGDILALLEDWWPNKHSEVCPPDVRVDFSAIDQQLRLPPGSTKNYISRVASRNGFKAVSSGNVVAVFTCDEEFGSPILTG